MMGHREKLAGDGFDAFARFWRRNLGWRAGQVAKVKKRYAKRDRKAAKITARSELHA